MCLGERTLDMRGHIVLALGDVRIEIKFFRNEFVEECLNIAFDVRVKVLLNKNRCRCVTNVNRQHALTHWLGRDPRRDILSYLAQALYLRFDTEPMLRLFHENFGRLNGHVFALE